MPETKSKSKSNGSARRGTMDMNTRAWRALHATLSQMVEPGPALADALAWCERYLDAEVDPDVPPSVAVAMAIKAWHQAHIRRGRRDR